MISASQAEFPEIEVQVKESCQVPRSLKICVAKMSTHNSQAVDSVIKPLDTIPEDRKVRVQRTQSSFDPFDKPTSQVKRVHSENNACINTKCSSGGKESPKLRRHSSPSSVSHCYSKYAAFLNKNLN
ncbi:hypothetical protein chiPu_0000185 [Chiloscyllium punctatum]|uniref:Uncharacterized protein n=1 Tax=Chiloscyllium punctatum TaxID=137246 RepID=A0A401RSA5_CHIPU|nr:hypothetical protein [Chiloscyllium punctatum]